MSKPFKQGDRVFLKPDFDHEARRCMIPQVVIDRVRRGGFIVSDVGEETLPGSWDVFDQTGYVWGSDWLVADTDTQS